ncbi:MAG TPA: hypothetical protein PKD85_01585, partial [Saprospiraceae bacterium]|nr:hypothetical protein [Saprospiraceae bacterium]
LFRHAGFNSRDGWKNSDEWIVSSKISSGKLETALNSFRSKLSKIIPRISLIGQSYIEFTHEPFIVHDISRKEFFFKYAGNFKPVGLMFMENQHKALKKLMKNKDIPDAFYFYWNEAVNSIGYSAKLLLMFSAIEALVKKDGVKKRELINEILGENLANDLFENSNKGLRHRLVHG